METFIADAFGVMAVVAMAVLVVVAIRLLFRV